MMFSIIVYILIKIYSNYSKNKSNTIEKENPRIKKSKTEQNSSSNSSIKSSNNNLSNSNKSIYISNNNMINFESNNISSINYNNSVFPKEKKNYDAPYMADYSEIIINDDNKTLTNNPDMFVPSRMDRILYKPYSKEEIK